MFFAASTVFDFKTCLFFFIVGGFLPLAVILILAFRARSRRRALGVKAPQKEKLLRPPGYSLMLEADKLAERGLNQLLIAFLLCGNTVLDLAIFTKFPWAALHVPKVAWQAAGLGTITILTGLGAVWAGIACFQTTRKEQNARFGMRGEQATAEALHEVGGLRVFHDVQIEKGWNIDHVAVSAAGVFLIETKARCRRGADRGLEKHQFRIEGPTLVFPSGPNRTAIPQAERNANRLSDVLSKHTAEPVSVQPIVVLPGWYVVDPGPDPVAAMGTGFLKGYLRRRPQRIPQSQVNRIIAHLELVNRTIDFW